MAKKKKGSGLLLLAAAAGVGVFIYSRREKEKAAVEAVEAVVGKVAAEQAQSGYFTLGTNTIYSGPDYALGRY